MIRIIEIHMNSCGLQSTAENLKPHDTLRSLLHNVRVTFAHGKNVFVVNNTISYYETLMYLKINDKLPNSNHQEGKNEQGIYSKPLMYDLV
jgi:transcription antitermination factor NusA-like protein